MRVYVPTVIMADILYSYHKSFIVRNNLCAVVVIHVGAVFDMFVIFKVRQSRKTILRE